MQKEHIPTHTEKKNKINRTRVIISAAAVVLSLCALTVSMLVAKYTNEKSSDGFVKADNFYFTSNLLDGKKHTLAPGSTSVTFTLGNNEDDLRYSEVDISYEVTVNNGATVTSVGSGTLTKGVKSNAEITVSNLAPGEYTVTAVGKGGYSKTLTATIVIPEGAAQLCFHKDDSAEEYTLLTVWNEGDTAGDVTINYTGIPDNTNPDMAAWKTGENQTQTVNIKPHESKVLRFFGGTVTVACENATEKDPY